MMEWKYTKDIPLIPVEIINPYNNRKSKHLALVDSGFTEVGFSWCNLNIAGKTIPVEIHYNGTSLLSIL